MPDRQLKLLPPCLCLLTRVQSMLASSCWVMYWLQPIGCGFSVLATIAVLVRIVALLYLLLLTKLP